MSISNRVAGLRCECCNKPLKESESNLCQDCDNAVQEVYGSDVLKGILDEVYYKNRDRDYE